MTHHDIQPGDGTRYDFVTFPDPYGGVLVVWPGHVTYRYFRGDCLQHLHGEQNSWTHDAIWNHLESIDEGDV